MADKAMDVYLNDHLAGATLGVDLAKRIRDLSEGTPLGDVMASISPQIEEDRDTLLALMETMGTSSNPVKQMTGWVAEKASRVKFSGAVSGEPDHGVFMALESLTLGVEGKWSLWMALREVAGQYSALSTADLDTLISRAEAQHDTLERERRTAGRKAMTGDG